MSNVQILSQEQFEKSNIKGDFTSYQDYCTKQLSELKKTSVMTYGQNASNSITESVKGYALEKEAAKEAAEARYYQALAQFKVNKNQQENALSELQNIYSSYGEQSSQFSTQSKLYKNFLSKTTDSEINWSIAKDHFNNANMSAFRAYLSTRNLQS